VTEVLARSCACDRSAYAYELGLWKACACDTSAYAYEVGLQKACAYEVAPLLAGSCACNRALCL